MTRPQDHDELMNSVRTRGVSLSTTDPEADPDDLEGFADALRGVDVVGMGEATHRTGEFARFKHRLFRHLATERGFRLFGLEAPFSETTALHDYVVFGTGDVESALERIDFDIYETEETAAFFEWMRAFNEGRPPSDRIAVYGFDVQSAGGAAGALLEAFDELGVELDAIESDSGADARETLATLSEGVFEGEDVDTDRLRAAERLVPALYERFESEFGADPPADPRSRGTDPALARRHAETLERACEFARIGLEADRTEQWGFRDRCMAEGVAWIRAYDTSDRIAIWAHDNHVKRGRLSGDGHPSETMGEHLARRYGRGYYALGAQFARGTVRAYVPTEGEGEIEWEGANLRREEVPVPDPVEGSVPDLFDRVGEPVVLLDYRSLPADDPLRTWLAEERPHRYVAGVVDPDEESPFDRDHDSIAAFDGVVFVREAAPTTPL